MEEDGMNALPDEIISCILSRMPIKDAAKTSILSTRWKCLWKFTRRLEFNERDIQVKPHLGIDHLPDWRPYYLLRYHDIVGENEELISIVDGVLDLIRSPTIDEFIICYEKCYFSDECIERWIIYAIERGVKRLAVDLTHPTKHDNCIRSRCYSFPLHVFSHSRFGSFADLSLAYINISGEAVEHILSRCPLLEKLSILHSNVLASLKVSSIKLKYLSIHDCSELKSIELLDAVNLESFTWDSIYFETDITAKNIPRLIELDCITTGNIVYKLESLPLLETLKLRLAGHKSCEQLVAFFMNPPILKNVKYLEVTSPSTYFPRLLCVAPLLKACPLVHTFRYVEGSLPSMPVETEKQKHGGYKRLKVLEYIGYDASPGAFEFLKHLIENSEMLETVVLNLYSLSIFPHNLEMARRQIVRCNQLVRELEPISPPGIKIFILWT